MYTITGVPYVQNRDFSLDISVRYCTSDNSDTQIYVFVWVMVAGIRVSEQNYSENGRSHDDREGFIDDLPR